MAESVKFIHASDFHLDEPMKGLAELPPHLKSVIANAPYQAARRVFDLAISCLLYTSPSPRDRQKSRMPSSA